MKKKHLSFLTSMILLLVYSCQQPDNTSIWPTYRHDFQRTGHSSTRLAWPLKKLWSYQAATPPKPAWMEPARTDYWHRKKDLNPRVTYDRFFQPVADATHLYYASSATDKVTALNSSTGKLAWEFFTQGPVRLSPVLHGSRLFVASDDGSIYCLDKNKGKAIWTFFTGKNSQKVLGNERFISYWPIRTGMVIENDRLYVAAGLFPQEGVYLYCLDCQSGKIIWKKDLKQSPQGYMVVQGEHLIIPTGRTAPMVFEKRNGEQLPNLQGPGGSFSMAINNQIFFGTGDIGILKGQELSSKPLSLTLNSLEMVRHNNLLVSRTAKGLEAYNPTLLNNPQLQRLQKEKQHLSNKLWDIREFIKFGVHEKMGNDKELTQTVKKLEEIEDSIKWFQKEIYLWQYKEAQPAALILTDSVVIAGFENKVVALQPKTGQLIWEGSVDGIAGGLATAGGKLFVTTDKGTIYGFGNSWWPFSRKHIEVSDKKLKIPTSPWIKDLPQQGYALIVNPREDHLPLILAKQGFRTLVLTDTTRQNKKNRQAWNKMGLYGENLALITGIQDSLPFNSKTFNLIICNDKAPIEKLTKLLHPLRGQIWVSKPTLGITSSDLTPVKETEQWKIYQRKGEEKLSEWTHLYAEPGNSACSQDPLKGPMRIQWFGKPGPRPMINRHSRPMSSLVKEGRVFIPADNRIICYDAYNGFPLWEKEIPDSRRVGALKDCGHMALSDRLFLAKQDSCLIFDVKKGSCQKRLSIPKELHTTPLHWGYLAVSQNQLFGTTMVPNASYHEIGKYNCNQLEGDYREVISSHDFFALNNHTGEVEWTYQGGALLNNTITIGPKAVYLIESKNPTIKEDSDGRVRIDAFCKKGVNLVKLSRQDGKVLWKTPMNLPYEHIFFLSYADNVVLLSGSFNNPKRQASYALYAMDAVGGKRLWKHTYQAGNTQWIVNPDRPNYGGSHGEQWQHPVISAKRIILPPYSFDLQTGRQEHFQIHRGGHGCGGLSGSLNYIFARGSNARMYDLDEGVTSGIKLNEVNRPGCWINIIPAGGIISMPESSSGCTCGYPIQSSFAFIPANN